MQPRSLHQAIRLCTKPSHPSAFRAIDKLSRGLDRTTAQSLLVYAFLADVLTGMSVASTRTAIESALISQLPDSQTLRKFR